MIERLNIVRFGALRDRDFAFSRTTVFFGPNESGKTTIFDALQECLSKPPRSRAEGKIVKQRYGDDLEASLVGGPEDPIDIDEFRNLYAVRASDLNVAIKDDVPWFSAVRARLFSGGIDPAAMMRALESKTSDHGGRALNKDIKQLTEKRDQIADDLNRMRSRHDELLAQRERLAAHMRQQQQLLTDVSDLERLVAAADLAASAAELGKERLMLEQRLAKHRRCQDLQKKLAELAGVTPVLFEQFQTLEKRLADLNAQVRLAEGRLADAQLLVSKNDQERAALEAELDQERQIVDAHQRLGQELQQLVASPPRRAVVEWHGPWIVAGLVAIATAIAMATWRYAEPAWLGGAAALIGAGVFCLLHGKRVGSVPDERAWSEKVGQISDAAGIKGDGTSLARVFAATIKQHALRQEDVTRLGRERVVATARVTALQMESQQILLERQEADARLRQALLGAGVDNLERYRERLQTKERLTAQLAELRGEELTADEALGFARRAQSLEEQGVTCDLQADDVWSRAVKAARQLRERLMTASAKARDLQLGTTREEGELQGKLQDLPEALVRLECELAIVEAELDDKQISKEAALMAHEVLAEMAADAETQMAGLASDIGALWASVNTDAQVRLPRLDGKAMAAVDATGTVRSADLLSSGTRDLFLLAARLALAGRAGREAAVLVLDDPFIMMDAERRTAALTMIAAAQERHGWQVVVFTKDAATADDVQKTMAESVMHRLGRQELA